MYVFLIYENALVTECLITHVTSITVLTTVCVFMSYQTTLETECLITHITHKRALNALCVLMCYQIPLFTECPIIHFTQIWTLTPMYITGISAFSTLYMKLFFQRTLVKTQRLNIRIYFDRKNNYFYSNVYIHYKSNAFEELLFTKMLDD